jgi:hypothetical protein
MLSRDVARRTPNLIEVSISLGRYTDVRAPDFGPPSTTGRASPAPAPPAASAAAKHIEPVRSKARVVASNDADPQGPTMLSSPAVNKSLRLEDTASRSGRGAYLLGAAVIALAVAGWVWGATRSSPAAATSVGELPTLPTAPMKVTPPPPVEPAASPASSVVPVASTAEAPRKPPAAPAKSKPQPGGKTKPSGGASDETLFSGRK